MRAIAPGPSFFRTSFFQLCNVGERVIGRANVPEVRGDGAGAGKTRAESRRRRSGGWPYFRGRGPATGLAHQGAARRRACVTLPMSNRGVFQFVHFVTFGGCPTQSAVGSGARRLGGCQRLVPEAREAGIAAPHRISRFAAEPGRSRGKGNSPARREREKEGDKIVGVPAPRRAVEGKGAGKKLRSQQALVLHISSDEARSQSRYGWNRTAFF